MRIDIKYLGRGYQLADSLPEHVHLEPEGTVAQAVGLIDSLLDEGESIDSCLVVVTGEHLGSVSSFSDRPLAEGDEVVLIAPVAGG